MAAKRTVKMWAPALTTTEMNLLVDALDSHAYWQLADKAYRNNGAVIGQGSDDPDARASLKKTNALYAKLNAALGVPGASLLG